MESGRLRPGGEYFVFRAASVYRRFVFSPIRPCADSSLRRSVFARRRFLADSPLRRFAFSPIRRFASSRFRRFAFSPPRLKLIRLLAHMAAFPCSPTTARRCILEIDYREPFACSSFFRFAFPVLFPAFAFLATPPYQLFVELPYGYFSLVC